MYRGPNRGRKESERKRRLEDFLPQVELEIVPGITSFATLAAKAGAVLVENREQLRGILLSTQR